MYIRDSADKELLKKLLKRRQQDEERMLSGKLEDSCHFGLSFTELFEDINKSINFTQSNGNLFICIDNDELPYHGTFHSKEGTYGSFADKVKIKLDVIERLKLIRQVDEARMGIWVFSAQRDAAYDTLPGDKLCRLTSKDDIQYIVQHLAMTFIATDELKHLIGNHFITDEEIRFIITIVVTIIISLISNTVAILIALFS